jgi:hypothetical protein
MKDTFIRPRVVLGRHPIETTRYLLATPIIDDFYDAVCRWIDNRSPGGMIHGRPRFGKTRAISYLTQVLPERFGKKMPIISLPCRDYRAASERAFFEDLLRAAGHAFVKSGSASARRDRLREFLYEKVEASRQDRLILFIDEAQKLHEHQYKWLMDLHNELDQLNVSLVVLLVGQDELLHQYSAFTLANKAQIIGRFMVHQLAFRGLRTAEEIAVCLNGYDEDSEYPRKSGWSFTRYFYPAAFSDGWRLAHHANDLWQAFLIIREEQGIPGDMEIPMQYFCRTVEYVLRHYGTLDDVRLPISIEIWKEAIDCSGYVDAERYVVAGLERSE